MKSQIASWPVGERGSMIYWRYPKLPVKDVLNLSSLQITLHVRSIISVTPLRKLVDLCLARFTFYFYWQVLPGSFLQGNNHPYIRVNGWYCVSSTKKILTKKLELPIDRVPFCTDCMTVIRNIANESKRFRHVCCQPHRRKNLTHLIGSA